MTTAKELHEFAQKLEKANDYWKGRECVDKVIERTIELHQGPSKSPVSLSGETQLETLQRYLRFHARRKDGEKDCIKILKRYGNKFPELWNYHFPDTGDTPLIAAISSEKNELAELMLDQPEVEIDEVNNFGSTALLKACSKGSENMIDKLIDAGASIYVKNEIGLGVLHELAFAASIYSVWKFVKLAKQLMLGERTKDGFFPVTLAVQRGSINTDHVLFHTLDEMQSDKCLRLKDDRGHSLILKAFKTGDLRVFTPVAHCSMKAGIRWYAVAKEEDSKSWNKKKGSYLYWLVENQNVDELRRI